MKLCRVELVPNSAGILRYVCDDCLREEKEKLNEKTNSA